MDTKNKILNIYNFIRDDISFGFNEKDELSASVILKDSIEQCNTKSTFLGYGIGTNNLQSPEVEWKESNTFIQQRKNNRKFRRLLLQMNYFINLVKMLELLKGSLLRKRLCIL